jgi:hypothetical protein
MSGQASRIPAADKRPEDFLPPPMAPVVKKVFIITVTRASGSVETIPLVLRPGDVAAIDGKTILEG